MTVLALVSASSSDALCKRCSNAVRQSFEVSRLETHARRRNDAAVSPGRSRTWRLARRATARPVARSAAPPVAAARRGRRYSCPRWFGPPRPRRPSAAPRSHREGGGDARLGGPGGSGRFGYLGREAKRAAGRDMAAQAQKGERRPHRALTMPHRRTVRMRATRRRGGTFDQLPKMALVNPASKSFAMSRTSPQPPPLHHA